MLVLAIVSLHFTGMTAFRVEPMLIEGSYADPAALRALALAIAGVALIIAGAGLTSYLIDDSVRAQSLARLRDMAMNDSLTGLPNRAGFNDRLDHENDLADETVRARRTLAGDLRHAVENDGLEVHYQVQASVMTGEIRGYEALLRWKHPKHGYIPPSEFIPLAEENGLILQIGEWVLRAACAKAATWDRPCKVAVNISPVQFVHAELPNLILEILMETGLPPARLELELTESTIFADKERSLRMLRQIKALGVSIALDDFGTGYSSLETLRAFPFDKIKLDRSFMSEVESSPQAKAIIRAVLALGKSLEIPVLAEGIETHGQLSLLGEEGCDEAQGFLLGRPVPVDQIVTGGRISITAPARAGPIRTAVDSGNVTFDMERRSA